MEIKLSNGKYTIIDDEDYSLIAEYRWHFDKGYAKAHKKDNKRRWILMHRLIMNPPNDKFIDHINRNKLDNRKRNLRLCNPSQNGSNMKIPKSNKSGFKGVSYTSLI